MNFRTEPLEKYKNTKNTEETEARWARAKLHFCVSSSSDASNWSFQLLLLLIPPIPRSIESKEIPKLNPKGLAQSFQFDFQLFRLLMLKLPLLLLLNKATVHCACTVFAFRFAYLCFACRPPPTLASMRGRRREAMEIEREQPQTHTCLVSFAVARRCPKPSGRGSINYGGLHGHTYILMSCFFM